MTQKTINTTPANTGMGDSPKSAFDKVNANFNELYLGGTLVNPPLPIEGATVVNQQFYYGVIDRYGTNTIPGTTPMGAAYIAAISQALQPGGFPVRFLSSAYLIDQLPVFGASTLMRQLDIGGNGLATQVILGVAGGVLFNFDTLNGVYLHDLVATGSNAFLGDGVHFGNTASTEAIRNRAERCIFLMPGVGIQLKNTNSCVVRDCKSWPDNMPALRVPLTVTTSNISHHLYMTGNFVHNCTIYDFDGLPSTSYAANQRGIKSDATVAFGDVIVNGNVGGESATNAETGLDIANWSYGSIIGISNENSKILMTNCLGCVMNAPNAIGVGGGLTLQTNSLQNTFQGVQQATLAVDVGSSVNDFKGCAFVTSVADVSTYPGNNYENCNLVGKRVTKWVRMRRQLQAYSASITPDLSAMDCFVIRVNNGTAFTINAPTLSNLPFRDGQIIRFTIRNESGGVMGAITWNGTYNSPVFTNPANGFNRTIEFMWDPDFNVWRQQWTASSDIPN